MICLDLWHGLGNKSNSLGAAPSQCLSGHVCRVPVSYRRRRHGLLSLSVEVQQNYFGVHAMF